MSQIVLDDCSWDWLNPGALWLQLVALYWLQEVHQKKMFSLVKSECTFCERREIVIVYFFIANQKKKTIKYVAAI